CTPDALARARRTCARDSVEANMARMRNPGRSNKARRLLGLRPGTPQRVLAAVLVPLLGSLGACRDLPPSATPTPAPAVVMQRMAAQTAEEQRAGAVAIEFVAA